MSKGPIIDIFGNKEWRAADNLLHRLDGPALMSPNGSFRWCFRGMYHRIDGLAVFEACEAAELKEISQYYLNGVYLTEEQWKIARTSKSDEPMVLDSGIIAHWREGWLYRDDGPALITATGHSFSLGGEFLSVDAWIEQMDADPSHKVLMKMQWG